MMKLIRNALDRDTQRGRLYKAERRALNRFTDKGADVSTPAAYQRKLDSMMASEWMRVNFPKAAEPVRVEFSHRMSGANANAERIKTGTSSWTMNMLILCHELGHTIVRRQYGRRMYACEDSGTLREFCNGLRNFATHYIAGHGPEYADVYLRLVREFIGYDQWKILREEFDASRIRCAAPEQYGRAIAGQFRVTALSFASGRTAMPKRPRNSNPSLSAKVNVNGAVYPSMWSAYQLLMPGASASHMQRNRKILKLNGSVTIVWNETAFVFTAIPK